MQGGSVRGVTHNSGSDDDLQKVRRGRIVKEASDKMMRRMDDGSD
jgi:hypothetical protein